MSAVDDSHVNTVTSASFHQWRTRWSSFVQVPLASVEPSTTRTPETSLSIGELVLTALELRISTSTAAHFLEACWMIDRCDARQWNLTQSLFELAITDDSVSGHLPSHLV